MNVYSHIMDLLKKRRRLHFTLLDPAKRIPLDFSTIAEEVTALGSSAIMLGGSTGISSELLDRTITEIKSSSDLPIILFPNSANAISKLADAIFFMSLLNSRDINYLIQEQVNGSRIIKKIGLEPISMGYLIIGSGETVGKIGNIRHIPMDDHERTISYAVAAQFFGAKFFYLEAGSNAKEAISKKMVESVKGEIDIPLIVGGGIKDRETAKKLSSAGADILVTGSILEHCKDRVELRENISRIIEGLE